MKYKDYPALYKHTDQAAAIHQRRYLRSLFLQFLALFIASASTVGNGLIPEKAAIASYLVALLIAVALQIWGVVKRPDMNWYNSRALAESVKTLTWKFMMNADPFDAGESDVERVSEFRSRIETLLAPHKSDPSALGVGEEYGEAVTPGMRSTRALPLAKKVSEYRDNRIREQLSWYVSKSKFNKARSSQFSILVIFLYAIAALLGIMQLSDPTTKFTWFSEPILLLATASIGWIQAKRFGELAASYSLTAHEVSALLPLFEEDLSEGRFQELVVEAEIAFSREHTQWAARA